MKIRANFDILGLNEEFLNTLYNKGYLQVVNGYVPNGTSTLENHLQAFDEYLKPRSYICGYLPSAADRQIHNKLLPVNKRQLNNYPNLSRWFGHIDSFSESEQRAFPTTSNDDASDCLLDSQVMLVFFLVHFRCAKSADEDFFVGFKMVRLCLLCARLSRPAISNSLRCGRTQFSTVPQVSD